ncbi:hypothetical protein PI125_g8629 [Phytophthora idaei]|nr:hypothetical protein PI125_g8629 [Phytophthora idaei]
MYAIAWLFDTSKDFTPSRYVSASPAFAAMALSIQGIRLDIFALSRGPHNYI